MDAYDKSGGVVDCALASGPQPWIGGRMGGGVADGRIWMEILVPSLARRRLITGRKHALFDQRGRDERRMRGQYGGMDKQCGDRVYVGVLPKNGGDG